MCIDILVKIEDFWDWFASRTYKKKKSKSILGKITSGHKDSKNRAVDKQAEDILHKNISKKMQQLIQNEQMKQEQDKEHQPVKKTNIFLGGGSGPVLDDDFDELPDQEHFKSNDFEKKEEAKKKDELF